MAIDLTTKHAPTVFLMKLKNADGSVMTNDKGEVAQVRLHSPASKVWEAAMALRKRRNLKKIRENGGKLEGAADDETTDKIKFLCAITEEFIGVTVPLGEGESGAKALVEAIYSNPHLGYIRDQVDTAAQDWGSFLEASAES